MTETVDEAAFKHELKEIILREADKDLPPEQISDDEPLFGPKAPLELDSIDGLQIAMALQERFGVTINDSKEVRRIMRSINTLADHLRSV